MPVSLHTDAHKHLVRVLSDARQEAGLSQTELADRLGWKQNWISNIEQGQRRVDVIEFIALARALGASPDALLQDVLRKVPKSLNVGSRRK